MNDERRGRVFIVHRSSFIVGEQMKEETLTKIPEVRDRLQGVRSYL